jgi:hypothetical protein
MAESELRNVTVNCPRCGMRAERFLKESGPITVLRDALSKCNTNTQVAAAICPSLMQAISAADKLLSLEA